jgi:hypothetical protein
MAHVFEGVDQTPLFIKAWNWREVCNTFKVDRLGKICVPSVILHQNKLILFDALLFILENWSSKKIGDAEVVRYLNSINQEIVFD